ncbi:hypothetical protein SAMN05421823_110143 [Catalinimonas alkaloidigena]|uniref:DUF6298 domain-containing protein n=1 Tax=Catalinimonas alkaloidigena TaxID=1075417 RepID=A0A1G9QE70_9BACT|nr:DUF6298 domain-containing protein [Catalinimonas alkaloidigena]SDM09384.1 hypothetical protein SAMN05421823_110143 [Catalinimonas alkaloidigena]
MNLISHFPWSVFCKRSTFVSSLCLALAVQTAAAQEGDIPVWPGPDGKLVYTPDSLGNRVPDFSYAGYKGAVQPLPNVPIQVVVSPQAGDATARIQAALDYVAALRPGPDGIRGAVLLEKGRYEVQGALRMDASGVVLRGSGMGEDGTVVVGAGLDRQTLLRVAGEEDRQLGETVTVTDGYVPVGAMQVQVKRPQAFRVGDQVQVRRPSTETWIQALAMEDFGGETGWIGWKPGERDVVWDREITAIEGNRLTLDAPLTTALDAHYGGGTVAKYTWLGRIEQVGIENLRLQSTYDENNPKDEAHRWMAITLENVRDAWVRQVVFEHFAGSAVAVWRTGSRITVEDCQSLEPVSEIGGQRRYTFWTEGQQTLFQRLYAEHGYHDFAVGFMAAGPNAFVQCTSSLPYSFSGAIDSWASGVLFDVVSVDGEALSFRNRWSEEQGAGWTAANSLFWQCSAARIDCFRPPTAQNWAFGVWSQFAGHGYWHEVNSHIRPRSLYYAQLEERLGEEAGTRAQLLPMESEGLTSPTLEEAAELNALARKPLVLLPEWISRAPERNPIPTDGKGIKTWEQLKLRLPKEQVTKAVPMQLKNGWLVQGDHLMTGRQMPVPWWRGNIRYYDAQKAKPAVTRWVPGRVGTGWTDDLQTVVDTMVSRNIVALDHNYGLWYERRRDDHERVRRMNPEVWAPFYEQPFARSGQGAAWDQLSKYDLTKYNPWYWSRLRQFAVLAAQNGLVLFHQNYFQHNILEAGAHWADSPWRPANNVNETDFPEPPPYAGDKRIFLAEQFYDIAHPVRRELHRAYIRQCLDNFVGTPNVIQFISAEYTGPLHFVEFWLDVVQAWQEETGHDATIALSTTKDVQDAILADPKRAAVVDVIDIRYWRYGENSVLYAPEGGKNLAPRQHARQMKAPKRTLEATYQAVREYRERYPDKAVLYSSDGWDVFGWGVFMGGGSLAALPATTNAELLQHAAGLQPLALPNPDAWALANAQQGEYVVWNWASEPLSLDLQAIKGNFRVRWINPADGCVLPQEGKIKGGSIVTLPSPPTEGAIAWVTRR